MPESGNIWQETRLTQVSTSGLQSAADQIHGAFILSRLVLGCSSHRSREMQVRNIVGAKGSDQVICQQLGVDGQFSCNTARLPPKRRWSEGGAREREAKCQKFMKPKFYT